MAWYLFQSWCSGHFWVWMTCVLNRDQFQWTGSSFFYSWTIGPLFIFHDFPGREERPRWPIFLPIDLVITFLSLLNLSILWRHDFWLLVHCWDLCHIETGGQCLAFTFVIANCIFLPLINITLGLVQDAKVHLSMQRRDRLRWFPSARSTAGNKVNYGRINVVTGGPW